MIEGSANPSGADRPRGVFHFRFSGSRCRRPGRFVEARALGASSVMAAAGAAIFVLKFSGPWPLGRRRSLQDRASRVRFSGGPPIRGHSLTAESAALPTLR